jgi:DNA-binding response OmpR family regulator
MRVLVVDDSPAYLAACIAVLTQDGHDVVAARSFEEGRRSLAEDQFDVLIADVRLGPYNGLHLITLAPATTIKLVISAFLDRVLRRDAEQLGARFVVKPSNVAALSALLRRSPASPPSLTCTSVPA